MTDNVFDLPPYMWTRIRMTRGSCWEWLGTRSRGYGYTRGGPAHRRVYEHLRGPVAADLDLDHLCLNKTCVNPAHLEPVTHAENMRRYNVLVTRCVNGHWFDEDNTYIRPSGHRDCKKCIKARSTKRRVKARKLHAKTTERSTA